MFNQSAFSIYSPLPYDIILDLAKLKVVAKDKINVAQVMILDFDRVEIIVGKGENAGYLHFFLSPQFVQKPSCNGTLKHGIL